MKSKKALIIVLVVLAVAIVAVLGFNMKPAENAEHDYFLVDQGDKVLVMDALKPDEVVAEFDNNDMNSISYCSKDNSSLILRENDDGEYPYQFSLVHYDIASGKKTVVDKNVTNYVVSSDFKTFIYVKENDSKLYKKFFTDNEPVIIAENVYRFYMTDDGETIIYGSSDGETYIKESDSDAVLLGKNVSIRHFERTTGNFVYNDGTRLVVHKNDKDTVVSENLYTGDSTGHIGSCDTFYFTEKQREFSALDLFEDDLDTALHLSYNEAEKLRNRVTDFFTEDYFNYSLFKVFYYDNGKISEVCDNVIEVFNSFARSPADKIAGVFLTVEPDKSIKLSDFYGMSEYETDGIYSDQFNALRTINIAKKDSVVKTFEKKHILECKYNYNTNEMYLLLSDRTDVFNVDRYVSDIYKMSLDIGSDEITIINCDNEVILPLAAELDGDLLYYTYDSEGYTLYKNGEIIVEKAADTYAIGDDIYYISKSADNTEKVMFYFDGKIHEYPDIDFSNRYAYTTDKGNILSWNTNCQYFYIINGETATRIDKKFESIITFSGEPYEFGHNEYTAE